jgi:hypothetical protein
MKRLIVALVAAAVLATGCGHPLIPAADLRPAPAPKKSSDVAIGSVNVTSKPLLGVDLYALSNYTAQQVTAYGNTMLAYIKNTLQANAVGIVWNLYAPSRHSNVIERTSNTLTAANVAILTQIAEQDGLKVTYRPLIFLPGHGWEGKVEPASPAKWFSSYYNAELPYLRLAQRYHVTEFVAETEMHDMNADPGWPAFFRRLSAVYHGTVTYASWDGDYFPPTGHLMHLQALGMDMYEAMPKLFASAPESRVLADFESYFTRMPKSVLQRTTIQEIGIQARAGAYGDPANLQASGRMDQRVQANWFAAACKTVRKYHMRGVFFWKVDLTDNPAYPAPSLSTFEGKQGAAAIASCASVLG